MEVYMRATVRVGTLALAFFMIIALARCTPQHSQVRRDYRNTSVGSGAYNPGHDEEESELDEGQNREVFSNKVSRNPDEEFSGSNDGSVYKKEKFYETGMASWYGREFHGKKTASGEFFDMNGLTAAHKNLPFGTVIMVKNFKNGKTVKVRVNDRGPYKGNRILDLSYAAAKKLDMLKNGKTYVGIKVLKVGNGLDEGEQSGSHANLEAVSDDARLKSVDSGDFVVQAGAFYSRRNAENLKYRIEGMIDNSVVVAHDDDLYKVRVVGFVTKEDAGRCRKVLSGEDIPTYIIRKNK
jgi:rare lipoprotein A